MVVNESSLLAGQISEKSVQKAQNIKEPKFPATTQSTETGRVTGNNSSINAATVPLTVTPINGSFPLETSSKSSDSTSTIISTAPLSTSTAAPPTTIETIAPPKSTLSQSSK
ncbi:unnamed protein product [Onchocerca flexuosa]|uniref:Flocculation protein FLO11-like n=1 Tax=Onchocerca flexuosa TaxID=387005 RepID=A0A183H8N9_9BILA|nr:unnamed protein product [Onchocerca flexuosa]